MDKKLVSVVKTRIKPERVQERLPQNESFWHVEYFKDEDNQGPKK